MSDANNLSEIDRKQRIRRNTTLLVLVALAFYVGFIVFNVTRA